MQNQIKNLGKAFKIKTFGHSMMPTFHDEDIVFVKKHPFSKIGINDIVCFRQNNHLVTHRVIYKKQNYVIAKGDNNSVSDGKIKSKNILGRVHSVRRNDQQFNIQDLYLLQSSIYFEEITKITKIFEKIKINFLILKGLPLHIFFENKHPKRIYADCDILVAQTDFNRLDRTLKDLGYKISVPLSVTGKKLEEKSEISYFKIKNGFSIVFDIHKEVVFLMTRLGKVEALYSQKQVGELTEKFLDEKENIKVNNETFPVLNNENLLIYLYLHLFNHNFKGPYRYYFINSVLKSDIDFDKTIQTIIKFNLENFIYPCLLLSNKYFPTHEVKKIVALMKSRNKKCKYITNLVKKVNIFDDKYDFGTHLYLLFRLSPYTFYRRILIIFDARLIYIGLWALLKKIKYVILQALSFLRVPLKSSFQ